MLKTTRTTCENFGDRQRSLRPKPMSVRRTLLFAGAIAAAAATQPEPAFASGNGVGIALGIIGGIIAGAAAANANPPPQPYYPQQPAYAGNSAACQSWLAVLNNPRYDAATRAQAQQIVSDCGLPYSTGGGPATSASGYPGASGLAAAYTPTPAYAPVTGATEIALSRAAGGYVVNGSVNGVPVPFVLDTGASMTQIPIDFARQLVARGQLTRADLRAPVTFMMANGNSSKEAVVRLSSVTVGGHTVYDVTASISPAGAPPLLGQNFLKHFGSYTIDNRRNMLVLG